MTSQNMSEVSLAALSPDTKTYMQHGSELPLYAEVEQPQPNMRHNGLQHWHDEVEFIHVVEGDIDCQIGDDIIKLETGDFCFINRNQIHLASAGHHGDFRANVVLADLSLLTRSEPVFNKYIMPILDEEDFTHLHITASTGTGADTGKYVDEITALNEAKPTGYEMTIIGLLHFIFQRIYLAHVSGTQILKPVDQDAVAQRRMAQYIYDNFSSRVTLDDIARAGNVSRSKCSTLFKRYTNRSPIDFLNIYRLEVASRLLFTTTESMSRIAYACGFSQQSYFNRLFARTYGCTPKVFRERYSQAS